MKHKSYSSCPSHNRIGFLKKFNCVCSGCESSFTIIIMGIDNSSNYICFQTFYRGNTHRTRQGVAVVPVAAASAGAVLLAAVLSG